MAVREATWDFRLATFGKQEPTVHDVKEAYEKAEKAGKVGEPVIPADKDKK